MRSRVSAGIISIALAVVFIRKADPNLFWESLSQASLGWVILGFLLFGATTVGMSVRWHAMACEAGVAVHPLASWKMCAIGHFFNTLLFGPMGGDTAKTALYHRYFGRPLSKIASACIFDRVLGLLASVIMGMLLIPLVQISDMGPIDKQLTLQLSPWHGVVALILLGAALALRNRFLKKPNSKSRLVRKSIKPLWNRLTGKPWVLLKTLSIGMGIQLVWCGLLGINLIAVCREPIPWTSTLWTFPLIGFIASTPFTIAGAGMREGAAYFFLKPYGIGEADIAAAALLTFADYFVWAMFGAIILGREEFLFKRRQKAVSL